jgi:hypothetical protein
MSDRPTSTLHDRGRLMNGKQIAENIFNNTVSSQWVRRNVAPEKKITLGRSTVMWWERDVIAWLDAAQIGGTQVDE